MMKRLFDIVASAALLAVLWPFMIVIAVLVRARLGAPVLFRQQRPGWRAEPFTMLKFRTMTDTRDAHGDLLADRDRLPPFGAWLRATSLDELPELFNVLKGDMSLVGPRPLLMEYVPLYSPHQARRHEVRPGLTGWAQVNGRNTLSWEERLDLDVWYVDNRSLLLDMRILLMTVGQVVRRRGINQQGSATMERFTGSGPKASGG